MTKDGVQRLEQLAKDASSAPGCAANVTAMIADVTKADDIEASTVSRPSHAW